MHLASLRDFINSGNNIYYTIAFILIAILMIIAIISLLVNKNKNKKKKSAEETNSEDILEKLRQKGGAQIENSDANSSAESSVDWEADQAVFVLPDELMEDDFNYGSDEKNDLFNRVAGYKPSENDEEAMGNGKLEPRAYEPEKDSDITSIIMTPIKAKGKSTRPSKTPLPPERKQSPFENDFIYDPKSASSNGIVQIYADSSGKYRFRFKSSNGQTVGHSQGYTQKNSLKDGINSVIFNGRSAEISDTTKKGTVPIVGRTIFEIYNDEDNKFRFRLLASNGKTILASQGYTQKNNCINAIQAIRDIISLHTIKDDTLTKQKEIVVDVEPFIESINKIEKNDK